jgi:hypothetical protein
MSLEIFKSNDEGWGSYGEDHEPKKKKRKSQDADKDGLPDYYEREVGIHDKENRHIRPHLNIGGNLKLGKTGTIGIPHSNMTFKPKTMKSLDVKMQKKLKLTVDIKNPNLKGLDLSKVRQPSPLFKDSAITKMIDRLNLFTRRKKRL